MNKFKLVFCAFLAVILVGGLAMAAGKSSTELGKQMFHNASLSGSANNKSCNSCHANGKGLEKAAENKKLSKAINKCLTGALEADKIDGRSVDMRSLKMYVQSL